MTLREIGIEYAETIRIFRKRVKELKEQDIQDDIRIHNLNTSIYYMRLALKEILTSLGLEKSKELYEENHKTLPKKNGLQCGVSELAGRECRVKYDSPTKVHRHSSTGYGVVHNATTARNIVSLLKGR